MADVNKSSIHVETDTNAGNTTITSVTTTSSDNRQKILDASLVALTSMTQKKSVSDKLTSRKFWVAFAGFVCGIIGMFGVDDNIISIVSFGVLSLGSIIAYIVSEGKMDITAAQSIINLISQIIDRIDDLDSQSTVTTTTTGSELKDTAMLNSAINNAVSTPPKAEEHDCTT